MTTDMRGLYIHIPFCIKKCNYCDFCSFPDIPDIKRKEYLSKLEAEISSYKRKEKIKLETVFFGGGTPTLLNEDEILSLGDAIRQSFDIDHVVEFTVEANPKTLTAEKIEAFKRIGANRFSIGLQSIHDREQKLLGRVHDLRDFVESYELLISHGINNLNVDLMYGIPEQTKTSFLESLSFVISLNIAHVSVYGLMLEEGTPFFERQRELLLPHEDAEAEMYYSAAECLKKAGYRHYEISNYAKPEFESKHNLKYWRDEEYIGVGIAAYSYFENVRYGNTDKLEEYLSDDFSERRKSEIIDESEREYEYSMLRLRLADGIKLSDYKKAFGRDFLCGREKTVENYRSLGLLQIDNDKVFLTDKGFYLSNTILSELL